MITVNPIRTSHFWVPVSSQYFSKLKHSPVHICIHEHTHTYAHVHMHLYYLQAHTSTHACSHMHACIYTRMRVCTCSRIHAHTHSNKQRTTQCFSPATANDYVDRLVPEVANSAVLVLQRQQGFPWQLAMQHEPRPTAQQVSATGLVRQTHLTWAGRRHKSC